MTKAQKAERAEAVARMHEWVKPGDTVYTILDHVSRSGMSRRVRVVVMLPGVTPDQPPVPIHPNHAVAHAIGAKLVRGGVSDSIRIDGCGFDAGHEVVYSLSHALYPDGFGCIGEGCPSNDHSNGDRDYTRHGGKVSGPDCEERPCWCHGEPSHKGDCQGCGCQRAAHWHRDGGYALRQRWL